MPTAPVEDEPAADPPAAPALLTTERTRSDAPSASKPQPAPAAPPPPDKPRSWAPYAIHGVVKRAGTKEVFASAEVVAVRTYFGDQHFKTDRRPAEHAGPGRFVLQVGGLDETPTAWDLRNEGWSVTRWTCDDDPKKTYFSPREDGRERYDVTLFAYETFSVRGQIVDDDGRPVAGAALNYVTPRAMPGGSISMGTVRLHPESDGRFEAGPFAVHPEHVHPALKSTSMRTHLVITVRKEGFTTRVVDPYAILPDERDDYRVVLLEGATWSGTLVDRRGRALPDVVIEMRYGDQYRLRRATRTDAAGAWTLNRLSPGKATLLARAYDYDAKLKREVEVSDQDEEHEFVAESFDVPPPAEVVKAFGLELVEVDETIREAFDVPAHIHVLIWDAGDDWKRLRIGNLARGFGVMCLGNYVDVKSLPHAVQLLNQMAADTARNVPGPRIVYTFWNERSSGTNTQYLNLTEHDLEGIKALDARFRDRYPKPDPAKEAK